MLTVYTENNLETGPEWSRALECDYITWGEYGFTIENVISIELLTPREIYKLYGFFTDEDMNYYVLTVSSNQQIYVQHETGNVFIASYGC